MTYMLNGEEITKERADEFIDDLAMFPYNEKDIVLSTEDRKNKYEKELKENKTLALSDALKITLA